MNVMERTERTERCPTCYENMKGEPYALICGHWVHMHCIEQQIKAECPLCRTFLPHVKVKGKLIEEMEITEENEEESYEDYASTGTEKYNGYRYKEEDLENWDEENPDGDSVYYD